MKLEKDFLLVKQLRNIKEDVMMRVDIKKAICYDIMEDALVQRELQLAHGLAQPCFNLSATGVHPQLEASFQPFASKEKGCIWPF